MNRKKQNRPLWMKDLIEKSKQETRLSPFVHYRDAIKPLAVIFFSFIVLLLLLDCTGTYTWKDIFDMVKDPSFTSIGTLFSNVGGEIILGLLGIVITMVAITVELAAQRYTSRVIELFVKDKVHITTLVMLSIASINLVIVLFFSRENRPLPSFMIIMVLSLIMVSLIIIVPYILYVFKFLDPANIISRIEREILKDARRGMYREHHVESKDYQKKMVQGIDQLTDIALNSIDKMDRVLATVSIKSLRNFAVSYISFKGASAPVEHWFRPVDTLRYNNADFVALDNATFARMVENRMWVEYKVMKQFEHIFRHSLHESKDICNFISQCLLMLGSHAANTGDRRIVELVIYFFNTFVRATLNLRDNRTCFNLLNHYRSFAENLVQAGEEQFVIDIATYFKFYGILANESMDMPFILETIAHDLCDLDKKAYMKNLRCHNELLDIILRVDVPLEGEREKKSLRGIRKAQILLAIYFMDRDDEKSKTSFMKIYWDIVEEISRKGGFERICSIIRELKYVKEEYWEIIERRLNLDYIPPKLKPHLVRLMELFMIRHILFYVYYRQVSQHDKAYEIIEDFMMVLDSQPEEVPMDIREYEEFYGADGLDNRVNCYSQVRAAAEFLRDENTLAAYLSQLLPPEMGREGRAGEWSSLISRFLSELDEKFKRC